MIKALTIFLILSIVIPRQIFAQSVKNGDYTLQIRKGTIIKGTTQNIWTIPTTLTNLSNDSLKYFSVLCSWQDFYSVDNENLHVLNSLCDKNTPIVLKLAPGQSKTIELKLLISQSIVPTFIRFRIGLNIIRANKPASEFNIKEVLNKENILWSNIITMQN